ncbi:heterokaryon incompatibility protein-domain-containing protein [Xylaria castorea]|nr:heterokaryon incompatibility protein-domain-containing protein [Xylaria castorea]
MPLLRLVRFPSVAEWYERDSAGLGEEVMYRLRKKSSSATSTIICNGKVMQVQHNLYDALLHLRQKQPVDYWIDAICINQRDPQERSGQVQMMGRIYRSAALVTVWLGTLPASLVKDLDIFIGALASQSDDTGEQEPPPLTQQWAMHKFIAMSPDTGLPDMSSENLSIVASAVDVFFWPAAYLFSRRWFSRLWVIQEMCLAREIVFFLGDREISPKQLATAIEVSEKAAELIGGWSLSRIPQWTSLIKKVPAFLHNGGITWTIEQWLEKCRGRKATDTRDLVYAGLSLMDPKTLSIDRHLQLRVPDTSGYERASEVRDTSEIWAVLHADYNVGASDVLLNLAACLLSRPGGLNTLFAQVLRFRNMPFFETQDAKWKIYTGRCFAVAE